MPCRGLFQVYLSKNSEEKKKLEKEGGNMKHVIKILSKEYPQIHSFQIRSQCRIIITTG